MPLYLLPIIICLFIYSVLSEKFEGENKKLRQLKKKNGKKMSTGLVLQILSRKYKFDTLFFEKESPEGRVCGVGFYSPFMNQIGLLKNLYHDTSILGISIITHEFGHFTTHKHRVWFRIKTVAQIVIQNQNMLILLLLGVCGNNLHIFPTINTVLIVITIIITAMTTVLIEEFLASSIGFACIFRNFRMTIWDIVETIGFYLWAFLSYVLFFSFKLLLIYWFFI